MISSRYKKQMEWLFALAGIGSGIAAILFFLAYPSRALITAIPAIFSIALLSIFLFTRYETLRAYSQRHSTIMGFNALFAAGLFIFAVFMLNMIIAQYFFRFDFSFSKRFSLSAESEKIVKGLTSDIEVIAFCQKSPSFNRAEELLETYRHLSRKIIYSVVDPDKNPSLAGRYGVNKYDTVVFSAGGKVVKAEGIGEGTITNSIAKIIRGATRVVYFVEGHGENQLDDSGRSGYSMLKEGIESSGYPVKSLLLLGLREIPSDTGVVVIGGPRVPFNDNEVKILSDYFKSGGSLIIMNESIAVGGIDKVMKTAGISLTAEPLSDPSSYLSGGDPTTLLIREYPASIVTENFKLPTVFPMSLAIFIDPMMKTLFDYTDIVKTTRNAYVGKNKNTGTYTIGISVAAKKHEGQMVIFGGSDFVTNLYYKFPGNQNLFRNIVDYLMGAKGLVTVSPRENFVPMYLSRAQSNAIYYISLFGMPGLILLSGFFVWLKRKKL